VADQDIVLTSLEGRLVNPQVFFEFAPTVEVPTSPGFPPQILGGAVARQQTSFSDVLSEVALFGGTYSLTAWSELFIDYFTDRPSDGRITRLSFDGATGAAVPTPKSSGAVSSTWS